MALTKEQSDRIRAFNPNLPKHRREIEKIVAEAFGETVPFPKCAYLDKYMKRQHALSIAEGYVKEIAGFAEVPVSPGYQRETVEFRDKAFKRAANVKIPSGYRSWAHIGAFWGEMQDEVDANDGG